MKRFIMEDARYLRYIVFAEDELAALVQVQAFALARLEKANDTEWEEAIQENCTGRSWTLEDLLPFTILGEQDAPQLVIALSEGLAYGEPYHPYLRGEFYYEYNQNG